MALEKKRKPESPAVCPVCGEDVPRNALACPECGADHDSGWKEDAEFAHLDTGKDEFDYNDFARREFGGNSKPVGISTVWWITALVLVVVAVVTLLGGGLLWRCDLTGSHSAWQPTERPVRPINERGTD